MQVFRAKMNEFVFYGFALMVKILFTLAIFSSTINVNSTNMEV